MGINIFETRVIERARYILKHDEKGKEFLKEYGIKGTGSSGQTSQTQTSKPAQGGNNPSNKPNTGTGTGTDDTKSGSVLIDSAAEYNKFKIDLEKADKDKVPTYTKEELEAIKQAGLQVFDNPVRVAAYMTGEDGKTTQTTYNNNVGTSRKQLLQDTMATVAAEAIHSGNVEQIVLGFDFKNDKVSKPESKTDRIYTKAELQALNRDMRDEGAFVSLAIEVTRNDGTIERIPVYTTREDTVYRDLQTAMLHLADIPDFDTIKQIRIDVISEKADGILKPSQEDLVDLKKDILSDEEIEALENAGMQIFEEPLQMSIEAVLKNGEVDRHSVREYIGTSKADIYRMQLESLAIDTIDNDNTAQYIFDFNANSSKLPKSHNTNEEYLADRVYTDTEIKAFNKKAQKGTSVGFAVEEQYADGTIVKYPVYTTDEDFSYQLYRYMVDLSNKAADTENPLQKVKLDVLGGDEPKENIPKLSIEEGLKTYKTTLENIIIENDKALEEYKKEGLLDDPESDLYKNIVYGTSANKKIYELEIKRIEKLLEQLKIEKAEEEAQKAKDEANELANKIMEAKNASYAAFAPNKEEDKLEADNYIDALAEMNKYKIMNN